MSADEGFELQHRGKSGQEIRRSSDDSAELGRGVVATNNTEASKVPSRQLDVSMLPDRRHRGRANICQKYINFLPTVAFSANTQASWEAVAVSFTAGLLNGGPVRTAHTASPLSHIH
jgi:hypothetical protein